MGKSIFIPIKKKEHSLTSSKLRGIGIGIPGGPKKKTRVWEATIWQVYTQRLNQKLNFICLLHNPARTSQAVEFSILFTCSLYGPK